ncbi:hypothetical protein BJ138DRAFT_1108560 [Hygrophoropsis aurantiaca]|uniref:Uncharacterized protein n=1 Tax=Hygrophoropsis aurantiaca TaxID=72124 RepID=A0ACB8AUB7_9AGAM|nr:hypothetical protein BJ138DRAFT_1108560 [Hygrophoropsis aurantiaca]
MNLNTYPSFKFLNLAAIYITLLTLALPTHAKCTALHVSHEWAWELHLFGAKGCAENLGHLILGGYFSYTDCQQFKNISLTHLNDVQSLSYQNGGMLPIRLYDNIHCTGPPFAFFPHSAYGTDSWLVDDINKDGFKRFVAIRLGKSAILASHD